MEFSCDTKDSIIKMDLGIRIDSITIITLNRKIIVMKINSMLIKLYCFWQRDRESLLSVGAVALLFVGTFATGSGDDQPLWSPVDSQDASSDCAIPLEQLGTSNDR